MRDLFRVTQQGVFMTGPLAEPMTVDPSDGATSEECAQRNASVDFLASWIQTYK